MQSFCRFLTVALAFGLILASVPGQAADKADADTINKLVEKLSSGRFAERVKAQKALEEIGLPALDALRKAAESNDPETKRRASELVEKLDRQVLGATILAPTKVHLQYKDTPVADAIADLQKKSGYTILLHDPENKLKDRKVTLDTGAVSFWEAYDQLCEKAGLVEADTNEAQQFLQPGIIQPGIIRPGVIQPLPAIKGGRIQIQPIQIDNIQILPVVPEKKELPPKKDDPAPEKPALKTALQADAAPAKAQQAEKPADAPAVQPAKQQPVARPVQAIRLPARRRPFQQPGVSAAQPIVLKDGKADPAPTHYSGAIRVKAMENAQQQFGQAANGELTAGLKVSPEPKIRWQQLIAIRIDKAVDDQGQQLMPVMNAEAVNQFGGGLINVGYGGPHQYVPVRLSKGEKASKELKELTGNLTAQVLAAPDTLITVDDVAKAVGKSIKGKNGGDIKVSSFQEQNGQIVIHCEFNAPPGVVGNGNGPAIGGGPIGIQILPAPPQKAIPLPAPEIPKLPGAFQVQDKPVQVQAQPVQVQIQVQQIQVGGGGVVQIGGFGGNGFGNAAGLELLDADGKVIPCVGTNVIGRANGNGPVVFEQQLVFQPQKDQKASKLVYRGSKSVNVDIPFSLKNVKVN